VLTQAPNSRKKEAECRVCFVEHDDAIHAATVRVRLWHRAQVKKYLEE